MPKEGQSTVTMPKYAWEKAQNYYQRHKKELKKKGIHSASKLVQVWVEEKCAQE